jgi:hypothetical protein
MAYPDRSRKSSFEKISANFKALALDCSLTVDQRALPLHGLAEPIGSSLVRFEAFGAGR